MKQRSTSDRQLWAQFDALEMGTGWDDHGHHQAADYGGERLRRFPPRQLAPATS